MMENPHGLFYLEVPMNRLREVRVIKRITQFQLRVQTGIHQSKISLLENGLVNPREDEQRRLAKVLGVRVSDIWSEEDKTPRKRKGLSLLTGERASDAQHV